MCIKQGDAADFSVPVYGAVHRLPARHALSWFLNFLCVWIVTWKWVYVAGIGQTSCWMFRQYCVQRKKSLMSISFSTFLYLHPSIWAWPHFSKTENLQRTVWIIRFTTHTHTQWKSCTPYSLTRTDHVLWPWVILIGNNLFFHSTDWHFKLSHASGFNQFCRERKSN